MLRAMIDSGRQGHGQSNDRDKSILGGSYTRFGSFNIGSDNDTSMVVSFLVNVFTNKRDAILSGKLTAQEVRDEYISIIEKHPFIVSLAGKSLGQEFFSGIFDTYRLIGSIKQEYPNPAQFMQKVDDRSLSRIRERLENPKKFGCGTSMVEQLRMRYMFAIVTANREKLHGPIKVHTNDEIRYFRHSILRLMSGAFDIRNIAIDKNSNDGKMYLAVAFGGCIGLHAEVNKKNLLYLLGHVGNRFGKKPFSDFCSLVQEQKLWHLLEYDREVSELVRRYGEKNDARTSGEVENTRGLSLGMA